MIDISNLEVSGFPAAMRGMRNPKNSWDRSDSDWKEVYGLGLRFEVGPNDLKLAEQLAGGGGVHAKYRRMIIVTMDINAPLYWWKEFDTYKVGTVANSCSTMHKIADKEFKMSDFSTEHLDDHSMRIMQAVVNLLNHSRDEYLLISKRLKDDSTLTESERRHFVGKQKRTWWQMIQTLPSSYNQKRTVQFSYENVVEFIRWRYFHKQDEWMIYTRWLIDNLPYFWEMIAPSVDTFDLKANYLKENTDVEAVKGN